MVVLIRENVFVAGIQRIHMQMVEAVIYQIFLQKIIINIQAEHIVGKSGISFGRALFLLQYIDTAILIAEHVMGTVSRPQTARVVTVDIIFGRLITDAGTIALLRSPHPGQESGRAPGTIN